MTDGMIVVEGEATSYTIVLNPPGIDRFFLHYTGANGTFGADDVRRENLAGAGYFHFGYPPLMRRMYLDGGRETAKLLERVSAEGLFTSLDMATPDPASEAGRIDWRAWLRHVLPHVDLFGPSLDEILFMLGLPEETDYGSVAEELLGMGARMVALKLGARGLYLRTSADLPGDWAGRELLAPCLEVEVTGTTGAGDCTLAGLLAGLSAGAPPETAVTLATAAGACSVERADSTSGIPSLEALRRRIDYGWPRRAADEMPDGWALDQSGVWRGPADGR
jgi:sugar/nucleoside kinase (ribokinase family)